MGPGIDRWRDTLRINDERKATQNAIALTLLEQCKGEGMIVSDKDHL